jgi:APA family basic amino acid/polyamine antiporter
VDQGFLFCKEDIMAQSQKVEPVLQPAVKPTLGLLGATINAMALIAPGAFLWITYQLQAAATAPSGASVASDTWAGIIVALGVCFLTAFSYAELAKIYPEAGFASCVYFAEKAFLDSRGESRTTPTSLARLAKLATGWAAHLFYWVYPGVMVAFMATLIGYLYTAFTGKTFSNMELTAIGVVFAFVTGYIGYRGVNGSTLTNLWVNVIQLVTLVIFSGLAIYYRMSNPQGATQWAFSGAWDVVKFHSIQGVLVQSTIAILILVGFESCTALAAETKQPEKTIPKAIILSLVIQGLFAYLFEYFATGLMVNEKLTFTTTTAAVAATATTAAVPAGTSTVTGLAAAAASSAPIGDMARLLGDSLFHGIGFGLMISMAVTVAIAVVGTTLACMNTAIRVTCGMAEDRELPDVLGFLHEKHSTPHTAMWVLVVVSSVIAAIGVRSVVGLTGITLASNLGTFVLYGLTCIWTIVAFKGRKDFNILKHGVIPAAGLVTNAIMAGAIVYLYIIGNADSVAEAHICFWIAGGWAAVSLLYVAVTTVSKSYRVRMLTCVIRPEQLNDVTAALKRENLMMGMTVIDVRGFGRQRGDKGTNGMKEEEVRFLPKLKLEILVRDWDVEHTMDTIADTLRTGNIGDGKIVVFDATSTMRIRTGEKGIRAVFGENPKPSEARV